MKTTSLIEFISFLQNQSIEISTDGEKLLCDAPQGVLTPTLRQEIAERKAEIIKFLQKVSQAYNSNLPPIKPFPRDKNLPLSFSQERLWFMNQLEDSNAPYIECGGLRIIGRLNVLTLERALSEIVCRHEVLRTSFQTQEGKPIQVIHPKATIKINLVDLQKHSQQERQNIVIQLATQEAATPFKLEKVPLIRCSLLHLSPEEYVLLLTMHHIVSDGWSMGILTKEISSLYQAFTLGKASPLTELPIQYADFAVWQRQYLAGKVLETQLNYWKQQLNGAPELLQLPTDRPRPSVQTYQGRSTGFSLNTDLTQKLQILSRQSGTTLFMTLYAAFATLLYRYSGETDILIGSPIANRNRNEIEPLIGFFLNNLVLRTRFEDNPSFKELLVQVKETTLKAYEHQDVPFERVVEALQPQRSLSHSPLFQVMFDLQNALTGELELPGCNWRELNQQSTIAKFDLTLSIMETDQGLLGSWEYNTDLFDASTIERMAAHFHNLCKAIVSNPQVCVAQLPLLSEAERHQLLVEWNNTATEYPQDKCIHHLFEQQVEKTPNAVAVVFEGEQLTYQQLNTRANQLAHHLKTLGVKPEVLVGICIERSIEMVVGLLAILKAGGAYVPIDPKYPQERLSYMLADSAVSVLLTQESLLSLLPKHQATVVCLDIDWQGIEQHSQANLYVGVCSDNLAYVIYTSGSTGQPKGVLIAHQSLVSAYYSWEAIYHLGSKSTSHLQMASFSFDVFSGDLIRALCSGGKLVLCPRELLLEPEKLYKLMLHEKVDSAEFVPAVLRNLVEYLGRTKQNLQFMRLLIVGSDSLYADEYEKFQSFCDPSTRFYNSYGVSEATIDSTYFESTRVIKLVDGLAPIGRPFPNTHIFILDRHLQPVPIGVKGELYISGDGLARGYLNRPELTTSKFIKNPFDNLKSNRLYKTGDLVRYLSDGNIEYLGRIDNQAKVRGFRIELGEIESVLQTHPHIQQAIVIATEDTVGNKCLVAYIVSKDETITSNQLHEFLFSKLPEYMVPNAFVTLNTLPLTPNGKVDRKALPLPSGKISREQEYVAPHTETEELVTNIFASVLGVQNVGIHDNFFSLGGHSLLATQLISRLRVAFEVEIELRKVFEFPTVAQLERLLTQLRTNDRKLSLPPIQPRTNSEQLPLSFAQERLWFLNQLEGLSATYNISGGIRIAGNLDINALQQALSEIVRRHEVLRTSFQNLNGTPIQVIHPQAATSTNINLVDLQQLEATQKETVLHQQVQLEAITPFDLETAPLIRCSLLQLDTQEYVLLLTMHHIVSDGWSTGIFVQELSTLYRAFSAGEPSRLGELSIQYADFAIWQRQALSGEVLETQLNYWVSQLEGAPELLQLPTDRTRPNIQTYLGTTYSLSIDTDLTQKLQTLSRNQGTTLFMTLQAAFATLLYRYSGQSDILIGSPIANRNRSEIEPLIGFFVNTLVLRSRFEDNLSFLELLVQVRETTLKAYEHQDVPFEQVVEALQPQRSLSHSPLFQVMFVLQNVPTGELELPGCNWHELNQQSTIAKFDLTLSIMETDQGLLGSWEYNTDLFDASTIERMAAHFHNLCKAIVSNPQVCVAQLPLLSEAERHQLLVEWNNTATKYPQDKCIHHLFEQQVEKTPLAVAVVFEGEQLTYQQLNTRANQLAHHLKTLGVKPEVLVGICIERSIEMVVGLLAILKAGGAYVPLDPSYPKERLSYMLADSAVSVLLTQESLLSLLPKDQATVVCLDIDWQVIEQHSQANLYVGVCSDNLAYVIYTSGSTGVPKGAMNTHQGIRNRLLWMQETYQLTSSDHVLQKTPFSFDVSVWEFFWPLLTGARIVVAQPEAHKDTNYLVNLILQQQITTIHFVPSMLQVFLQAPNLENCNCLKRVFCSGEALSKELTQYFFSKLECELYNLYGPTEAAIDVTFWQCQSQENLNVVPIGRPIANTQIYILDSRLQPAPIGVCGELYIGGDGLARGYLNRPELTQEKFISNLFSSSQSERLYKTGDLARYLPSGDIEYLGRIDYQVKLRGFRIELGEIESVLNTHSQIQQAIVIATEDALGNKCLVAYVVSDSKLITTHELRDFTRQKLPEYMVPSAFVTLDTLPLTPNGKVDRKALAAANREISREHEYVAPRTAIELQLSQIWSSVINITPVGVRDNFFELGGHSLLAVRLISQIQQHFQINLPLATLFQNPTIEQLAHILHSCADSLPWSALVPIKSNGNQSPLFCIHPVGGNVLCYQDLASYLSSEQPLYGLQAFGLNPQNQPHTSIEQMATHYIQELQAVQPHGPYFLSGWSLGGLVAFEMAQQLSLQGEQIALLALIDTYPFFRTSQEPEDDTALLVDLLGEDLDICLEQLRQLEPEEQLIYLVEQAKQTNLVSEDFDLAYACHLLEIYKLNAQASKIYQPQYYSGSVVLFKTSETAPDVESTWNELVENLETYVVPGNHQNMVKPPYVKVLAEKLQKSLEKAQANQLEKSNA